MYWSREKLVFIDMKHYLLKCNIISLPSLVSPFDKCLNVYTPVLHCLTTGT